MTNAELKYNETVPAFLKKIADAAEKIAENLSKANRLKTVEVLVQCGDEGFKASVMKLLSKELGFAKPADNGGGGKEDD